MILALDTSLNDLRIGLADNTGAMLTSFIHHPKENERGVHDRLLASETKNLLESIGASAKDIRRIGYISGPGSFTGLRIGLSFIKGIAFVLKCEVTPITAHQVMKRECGNTRVLLLYPGYEKSLVYSSPDGETITLAKKEDLPRSYSYAGHSSLQNDFANFTALMLPLEVLAAITAASDDAIDAEALAALEPFYGTDFKPHTK